MHQIIYSIRRIPSDQLPTALVDFESVEQRPATDAELLNMGIQHLHDDLYSCAEQLHSRVEFDEANGFSSEPRRVWFPATGINLPGEMISGGTIRERHAALSADVRPKVLRADVFRSTDPAGNALETIAANLNEQLDAIIEFVGDTPTPILDPTTEAATIAEAERAAGLPTPELERVVVPMVTIDAATDLVVKEGLIPHVWAGERY